MIVAALKLAGNFLYFIGVLILLPAGLIIIMSSSTFLFAGPIALFIPVLGAALGGAGKWMKSKARQLEDSTEH